jgi:periplasmic protein TonB
MVSQSWFSRLISVGIHAALLTLALIPWTASLPISPKLNATSVVLYTPTELVSKRLTLPASSGGGGGGKRQPTPASRGTLPRAAEKQLAPPTVELSKNPDPALMVEPTIVAPQLAMLRPLDLSKIGDPDGVIGPPSSGPGDGGGIGNGNGRGDGGGDGPGGIKGTGGGCCEGAYHVRGGITPPVIEYRVDPEYSEEARKARYQGTVILEALFRRDGKIDVVQFVRRLGFGLDQNAIEALKKWRFRPGMKNGVPVDTIINVEVTFNIR